MEANSRKKTFFAFLPWTLTLAVLVVVSLLLVDYYGVNFNPFETQFKKAELLSEMKIHLLEAVEAEKYAVLAITDEASENFAAQARQAAGLVEDSRKEIESSIYRENLPQETGMINEFNVCWGQYRKLDETILGLAVQHTNLKAQKISATQCAQEMERFEESLNRLIRRNMPSGRCNQAAMLSYEALTASLKVFALHKPHIEEPEDRVMDQIEQRIESHDASARKSLESLHHLANLNDAEDLRAAETAYARFMDLTRDVLKLSRMNTNINSAELSLGKKRLIAAQCQEILTSLQKTVHARGNYPLPRSKKTKIEE
jgi:hypothetical protein